MEVLLPLPNTSKIPQTPRIPSWQAVRTDRWKYIRYTNLEGVDEFYDLASDPYEMRNLINDPSAQDALSRFQGRIGAAVEGNVLVAANGLISACPVRHGMIHWPDNPVPEVVQTSDMKAGAVCNSDASRLRRSHRHPHGLHAAFRGRWHHHRTNAHRCFDRPARLIAIDEPAIRREHLEPYHPQRGERLLIKTSNSERCGVDDTFREDYVGVEDCAAKFLVECGIRTIGVELSQPWLHGMTLFPRTSRC
jgi:hypothetical protein